MIKAIIFDFGDTLVESSKTIKRIQAEKLTFNCFKKNDLSLEWHYFLEAQKKTDLDYQKKYYVEKYKPPFYTKLLFYHLYGKNPNSRQMKTIISCSNKYYKTFLKYLRLKAGAYSTLRYIKKQKIKLFLVSNGYKPIILKRLRKLKLSQFFEKVIVSSELGEEKSSLTAFKIILSKLNIHPQEILVVGDRQDEDVYAKKIGMKTALLVLKETRKYFKATEKPDYKINSIKEVKNIVFKKQKEPTINFDYFTFQWSVSRKKYNKNDFEKEFRKLAIPFHEKDYRSMDIARFWEKIFKQLYLKQNQIVFEFCTGLSPKISYALGLSKFKGIYYSIDTNKNVSKKLKEIISHMKIKFSYKIFSTKKSAQNFGPVDFVVSNHGVDDLFFDTFCKMKKIKYFNFLENIKAAELVQMIKNDPLITKKAVFDTAKAILFYTKKLKTKGFLVLSNYPPPIDIKRKNYKRIRLLNEIFKEVCKIIGSNGFSRIKPFGLEKIKSLDNKKQYWAIFQKI
ncbi:MAG: HAD family hydrolase [Candidatus Diapherotrites archaeon]